MQFTVPDGMFTYDNNCFLYHVLLIFRWLALMEHATMPFTVTSTGMHFTAPRLFLVASDAYKRITPTEPSAIGEKNDALVSLVFSVASLEAFFNELPELLADPPELFNQLPPEIIAMTDGIRNIESDKGSVEQKFKLAFEKLSGHECDKGASPYQDLSSLIEVRNGLVHMKPDKFSGQAEGGGTLAMGASPRIISRLRSKGILADAEMTLPVNHDAGVQTLVQVPLPWHDQISTYKAAKWACNTAADVVNNILAIFPDIPHKHNLMNTYSRFQRLS